MMCSESKRTTHEFQTDFTYRPILGGHEPGVTRRDPSPVIRAQGLYHVWYSRSTVNSSGYHATIWHATSIDGYEWEEQGMAVDKGTQGAWDENGVFTPTILVTPKAYFLFFTGVPRPFQQEDPPTPTAIGVAVADCPDGPWARFKNNPVLVTGTTDAWDSCRVDDSCLIVRGGEYWLYYKGRQAGLSPAETKMGFAIADRPTGPYRKHPGNPVLGSGHEVCVWPHGEGIAALVAPTGPEGGTVQYSPDGLHFTPKAEVRPPSAPGPYRTDGFGDGIWGEGITWGICQNTGKHPQWPFLMRFDCDLRARRQRNGEEL